MLDTVHKDEQENRGCIKQENQAQVNQVGLLASTKSIPALQNELDSDLLQVHVFCGEMLKSK